MLAFILSLPPAVMLFPLFDPQLSLLLTSQVDRVNFVAVVVIYSLYNDCLFLVSCLGWVRWLVDLAVGGWAASNQ